MQVQSGAYFRSTFYDRFYDLAAFTLAATIVVGTASVFRFIELAASNTVPVVTTAAESTVAVHSVLQHAGYTGEFGFVAPLPQGDTTQTIAGPVSLRSAPPASPASAKAAQRLLQAETKPPKIKIGLTMVNESWVTVSSDKNAVILLDDGTQVFEVPKNEHVIMRYDRSIQQYRVQQGDWSLTTGQAIRFKPKRNTGIVTVHSYENRPSWNTSLNDNTFYGEVRIQFSNPDNNIWLINTLGIERYVKGIAEASNNNDEAYLKALYTAARTYVYYHYLHPTKYAGKPFLLTNTANDQVYRGKGFTDRSPNIVTAVENTRGRIITYNNAVIVAAYFSQSDGRTRSWSEVWGGEKAYAQSKEDPCCTDKELLGHGVGMSAAGARYFAEEENWSWKNILKYYYTGVQIEALW